MNKSLGMLTLLVGLSVNLTAVYNYDLQGKRLGQSCGTANFKSKTLLSWQCKQRADTTSDPFNSDLVQFGKNGCAIRSSFQNKTPRFVDTYIYLASSSIAAMQLLHGRSVQRSAQK